MSRWWLRRVCFAALVLAVPKHHALSAELDVRAEKPWQSLYDANPQARILTAQRLGHTNTVAAHVGLVELLTRDPDPRVRAAAARAMAHTHNSVLLEPLEIAKTRDYDPSVREAAAAAHRALRPFGKKPRVAGGLALLPGVGHLYLGQYGKAAAYAGTIVGLSVAGALMITDAPEGAPFGNAGHPDLDANDPIGLLMLMAAQNTLSYSIFDAYRSARVLRLNEGYHYPVSEESLTELLLAPFNPSVLKSPWVWASLPLMVAAGVGLSLALDDGGRSDRTLLDPGGVNFLGRQFGKPAGIALGSSYFGALFAPVGVGEEALFRGVLLPAFSESFGVGWGLTLSSLLFGAAHISNFSGSAGYDYKSAGFAVPFITLAGAYMGLVATRHDFTLARSVAIHFWYDFLLSTVSFALDPDHQPFVARFAMPL